MQSPEPRASEVDDVALTATFSFPKPDATPPRPLLPPRRLQLEIMGGPQDGARGKSEADQITIGRAAFNDLAVAGDATVSTEHARIVREDQHYWLQDLSSRNGTYLGDRPIGNRTLIGPGIRFQVGATHVEFLPTLTTSVRYGAEAATHLPLAANSESVLASAGRASLITKCPYLGVEHLFLGLLEEEPELISERSSLEVAEIGRQLREYATPRRPLPASTGPDPTPRCRLALDLAGSIAASEDATAIEPRHLLRAILREARSLPVRVLRSFQIDLVAMEMSLDKAPEAPESPTPVLEKYGRDLTQMARNGGMSPVIGRAAEISLLAQVILRRGKNNPVLVGDAGVGKTAVVEGLAQQLVASDCPEPLKGRTLIEISLSAMVAGSKFRGEFEERLVNLIAECQAHPEIILFLDELHTVVGAGSAEGAMDASNILKPALARGELRCIGATTMEEYRRHIEADPALERRFEKVLVEEPSSEDALAILEGLRMALEAHHDVQIEPDALRAAVDLTVRHVPGRRLPDKALDVVDQTCARARLARFTRADGAGASKPTVRMADIVQTVSDWTGIPLERMKGKAARQLLTLEDELGALVIGQDHAVEAVARTIVTARAGLADPNRPLGVFFFAGPTGVGKTWLAKSLAQVLFGDEKRLVRIDMSEYMQEHSVANLIGAPPGYVGHEREGSLISALRTHPHSVVLFDEIEKAHPRVLDLFLQIFDDGRLTGTNGKVASFTQSVVILTSNLNVSPQVKHGLGFNPDDKVSGEDPRDLLKRILRPELVNRMDSVLVFEPLDEDALREIVDHALKAIGETLAERDLQLELGDEVYAHLVKLADASEFGAREIRRIVDRHIRHPLAEEILRNGDGNDTMRIHVREGELVFEAKRQPSSRQ
ncbi:MAG: ATP-dependent Clp protease ATP-binding subunit ClpC [Chlamydiales bacterium]|jgi:ATP-dependent Clp protease ATP-binding subunit ClpC